jgi:hypothetical protein
MKICAGCICLCQQVLYLQQNREHDNLVLEGAPIYQKLVPKADGKLGKVGAVLAQNS